MYPSGWFNNRDIGADIGAEYNAPVYFMVEGVGGQTFSVFWVGRVFSASGGLGPEAVVIRSDRPIGETNGKPVYIYFIAGHGSSRVTVGQQVSDSDIIYSVGSKGNATGPHLDYTAVIGKEDWLVERTSESGVEWIGPTNTVSPSDYIVLNTDMLIDSGAAALEQLNNKFGSRIKRLLPDAMK